MTDEFMNNAVTSAAKLTGVTMQAQSIATSVLPAVAGGLSTSAILLVGFLGDVDIYKYINVDFPENFVSFVQQMGEASLPNIFQNLDTENEGDNPSSTIGKFQFWDVSTTLLDNSNVAIFKNLVTLGIILGLNILMPMAKFYPRIHVLLNKLRGLFMWNLFLSYFLGDFSELLLHSMIQLRESYASGVYTSLSFAFAVLIVVAYPLLFGYLIYKLNKKRRVSGSPPRIKSKGPQWEEVPASIGILVEDFLDKNTITRNFLLILLLESFLQILVVFFLQVNGLTQAILYTLIVVVYTLLTAWQRPYKSKVQMSILLLNLISKAVMGIMTIIFGINDITGSISQTLFDLMGVALIVLILLTIVINLLISIIMTIYSIYEWVKEWRAGQKKKKSKKSNARITSKRNNFIAEQKFTQPEEISLDHHDLSRSQLFQQLENTPKKDNSESTNAVPIDRRFIDLPKLRQVSKKNRWDISHRNRTKQVYIKTHSEANSQAEASLSISSSKKSK